MKFTPEGKEMIENIIKENGAECLAIFLEEQEDGSVAINLNIGKKEEFDRIVKIDGLDVALDEETENALEDATFKKDGDELAIEIGHCCCGEHHHEEGECCCDDDCCCKDKE